MSAAPDAISLRKHRRGELHFENVLITRFRVQVIFRSRGLCPQLLARPLPITTVTMARIDRASQVLAQSLLDDVPRTYAARAEQGNVPLSTLHHRAKGRRSREEKAQSQQYLSPEEETAVVRFLLLMSSLGKPVRIKFIPSLAFSVARRRCAANRPRKPPGKNWPRAFQKRHPELKARKVKAIDWKRHDNNIHDKMVHWFEVIATVLQDPAILPENVYNMDETGVMLSMLGSVKVLVGKDDLRDYRGAGVKRKSVTAIECISADGRSLLPLIIWPASTHRSNWTTYPTPGWHYAHSEKGYNDSKISLEWLTRVFDPQTKQQADKRPRVLICDGFGTHETLEILEFCLEHNIVLCRLPSHTSHKLQPCDVAVFASLKAAYRDQVDRLNRGGVDNVGKEHFTSLYSPARIKAFTKRNITAAWAATGLFPFNPQRVLKDIPKPLPPLSLIVPTTGEIAGVCPQGQSLQTPVTPVTPVTAEALASLHDMIKQDARTLDERSKQRIQRRVQKLATAARISFAERALLQDHNRFLSKINSEVKARQSTKSLVLGKAKVMSYEALEEARAKRATKEADVANKAKNVRNRKNSAAQTGVLGPRTRAARISEVPEPWKAPVARMVAGDWC
jgi:hypothetical protein